MDCLNMNSWYRSGVTVKGQSQTSNNHPQINQTWCTESQVLKLPVLLKELVNLMPQTIIVTRIYELRKSSILPYVLINALVKELKLSWKMNKYPWRTHGCPCALDFSDCAQSKTNTFAGTSVLDADHAHTVSSQSVKNGERCLPQTLHTD